MKLGKVASASASSLLWHGGAFVVLRAYLWYRESQLRSLPFHLGNRHWQCQQRRAEKSVKAGACGGVDRRKHYNIREAGRMVPKQNQSNCFPSLAPLLYNYPPPPKRTKGSSIPDLEFWGILTCKKGARGEESQDLEFLSWFCCSLALWHWVDTCRLSASGPSAG